MLHLLMLVRVITQIRSPWWLTDPEDRLVSKFVKSKLRVKYIKVDLKNKNMRWV